MREMTGTSDRPSLTDKDDSGLISEMKDLL